MILSSFRGLFRTSSRYFSSQPKKNCQSPNSEKLDYRITRPTKPPKLKLEGLDPGKEPVVYLLGWGGCRQKDLAKYGNIYEDMGFPTFQSIASIKTLISTNSNTFIIEQAKELITLGRSKDFLGKPIVFHMFSNGGSSVYYYVSKMLRENTKVDHKIVGCIFDSAPAVVDFKASMRFIYNMVPGNVLWRYVVSGSAAIWLKVLNNWQALFDYLRGKPYVERRVWQQLVREPNICPQLFLYSTTDSLTNYKKVETFIKQRRDELGVKTVSVKWDDTEHVAHLRKHREEYVSKVRDFVKMCLLEK